MTAYNPYDPDNYTTQYITPTKSIEELEQMNLEDLKALIHINRKRIFVIVGDVGGLDLSERLDVLREQRESDGLPTRDQDDPKLKGMLTAQLAVKCPVDTDEGDLWLNTEYTDNRAWLDEFDGPNELSDNK